MRALNLIGYAIEFVGLSLTAYGLYRSWRASAAGQPFAPRLLRLARRLGLIGKETPSGSVTVNANLNLFATEVAKVSLGPNAPIEQRVERLETDVDRLLDSVGVLQGEVRRLADSLARAVEELTGQITRTRQEIEDTASADSLFELRPAIYGISLAAVGLLCQWISAF